MTTTMKPESWRIWCYALTPGWENTGGYDSREEARDVRAELIEYDGYEPDWVVIRRDTEGPPKRRPSKASIDRVRQALKAGADR